MSVLFQQTNLGGIGVQNRFVRSATWEAMATDNGESTRPLNEMMATLAKGKVGVIISGHAYVSPEGKAGPRQLGVYSDELLPGLGRMADAVHADNGRIVMQLAHAGCRAATQLTGLEAVGPSPILNETESMGRAMSRSEVEALINAFGQAAARARRAGFDGVQIHAAHGYLLSQFLSPYFNRRDDDYGGNTENRARIVCQIIESIGKYAGDDYPVWIKMNSEDFLPGGLVIDEMLKVARLLVSAGVDAIELSGGTALSGKRNPVRTGRLETPEKEVYYRQAAKRFKASLDLPLILVGGIRSFEVAEQIVEAGLTDYVALCRPLIREPGLIKRWSEGDLTKSGCLSDNQCFTPVPKGKGVYCVTAERQQKKRRNRAGDS